jgi:purine-binding chemotaxis protein CheW
LAEIDNDVAAEVLEPMPEEEIRICLFSIGEDLYAIPVEMLTEIIIPQKIFPVPTTPPHVLGVINLRGNIVPIVDIRPALALPRQETPGQIAIIKNDSLILGIVVDNVSEVVAVPESSVIAIPPDAETEAGKNRNRFLKGAIQREAGVAALLDIMQIFEEIKLT